MIWLVRLKRPRKYYSYKVFIRESRATIYAQRCLQERGAQVQIKYVDWEKL